MKRLLSASFALFAVLFVAIPLPASATTGYAVTLRNAQLDAITTAVGSAGKLDIYDGTRPATCAVISTQNKLAEFTLGSPFAPAASAGVLSPTLPSDATGLASGTATWYRVWKSDGTTCEMDGSATVTGGGGDIQFATVTFSSGLTVHLSSWTITRGNS